MAQYTVDALYCGDFGANDTFITCCSNHPIDNCDYIFDPNDNWFQMGCPSGNCAIDCQNVSLLYSADFGPDLITSYGPFNAPWQTCANIPNIAGYLQQNALAPNISNLIKAYVPENISQDVLQNITSSVTMCLMSTCNNARNPDICTDACEPIKLLTNQTMPNYAGMNDCLFALCTNGYQAVPFANTDIVGIGVFTSYVMQCGIILLIWAAFAAFALLRHSKAKGLSPYQHTFAKQRELLVTGLVEFQKAQCFFSSTLQIASIAYGLYNMTDFLTVFLLVPLSMNGIVPVTFGHMLVLRFGRSSVYLTALACISWALSSIVFWSLYMHFTAVDWSTSSEDVYDSVMFKLAANNECGGSSALTACPQNFLLGEDEVFSSSRQIHVRTPILWTWGTVVLFTLVSLQIFRWLLRRRHNMKAQHVAKVWQQDRNSINTTFLRAALSTQGIFWITSLTFIAAMGMQLSLLYVEASIDMIDSNNWSFGQIIAITVWIPPIVEYVYLQLKGVERAAELRLSNKITMMRVRHRDDSKSPSERESFVSPKDALPLSSVQNQHSQRRHSDSMSEAYEDHRGYRPTATESDTESLNADPRSEGKGPGHQV